MNALYISVVVAVSAFLGVWYQEHARSKAQEATWAHDVLVAARVETAANQAAEAAALLVTSNAEVARVAEHTGATITKRLGVIHDLVNSNLQTSWEETLSSNKRELILLYALSKVSGHPLAPQAELDIPIVQTRINEYTRRLAEREVVQAAVDAATDSPQPER